MILLIFYTVYKRFTIECFECKTSETQMTFTAFVSMPTPFPFVKLFESFHAFRTHVFLSCGHVSAV